VQGGDDGISRRRASLTTLGAHASLLSKESETASTAFTGAAVAATQAPGQLLLGNGHSALAPPSASQPSVAEITEKIKGLAVIIDAKKRAALEAWDDDEKDLAGELDGKVEILKTASKRFEDQLEELLMQ
jgi:hypothetical protein